MLKKLTTTELDDMMEFWKYEVIKSDNSFRNQNITDKYTKIKKQFITNLSSTTIYTEDDNICGYVSVNNKNEIWRNTCKIIY